MDYGTHTHNTQAYNQWQKIYFIGAQKNKMEMYVINVYWIFFCDKIYFIIDPMVGFKNERAKRVRF